MSNLPWLKLYTEARTDRKLACLTRAEKGVWIDLLMYAADQDERGTFDASDRFTLAMEVADGDEELLQSTLDKLLKVRHITYCAHDVTSETSGNEGNEHVTTKNSLHSLHRYIFRTFAARQAQKVSNFPSDAPDRVNERVRKHRASRKQAKTDGLVVNSETSETSGNDTEGEVEREKRYDPTFSSSGEVTINAAVVAPAAPAAAAATSMNGHNHWNAESARRTAEEVIRKIRLPSSEIPDVMDFIKACPALSHERIIAEVASYRGWLARERASAKLSVFYNKWLMPANTKAEIERQQQSVLALQNGKGILDGQQQHQQPATNGATASAARPAEPDIAYAYNLEQAKQAAATRAKLVS